MDKPDKISQLLNVPPLLPIVKEETADLVETNPPETEWEQAENDFDTARDALLNALEKSQMALEDLVIVAKGSQHPRAFEALATIVDSVKETSKDLIDIHQKKKDLIKKPEESKTINNNLVISTTDLLKMIKHQGE